MATQKRPSKALLNDLKAVFDKHAWPGHAVGLRALAADAAVGQCVPPKTPHEVTYQTADGTWVNTTVCL
jgi:hypothetical protein